MSHLLAEVQARRAEMVPQPLGPYSRRPTADERRVFRHFGLSKEAQRVAVYSARRSYPDAKIIYRMIAGSL